MANEDFTKWSIQHGTSTKLELDTFADTGRGLKAAQDLKIDEEVISVPLRCILCAETIMHTDLGPIFQHPDRDPGHQNFIDSVFESPFFSLVALLIYEKHNPNSFWAPYFKQLPKTYDTPSFWDVETLELLKGSEAYNTTIKDVISAEKMHTIVVVPLLVDIYPTMFPKSVWTLEETKWALSTIWSRGFWIDKENKIPCIVPFADMFNHYTGDGNKSNRANYYYDNQNRMFRVITKYPYNKGEQVFITYGYHPNEKFLCDYGFLVPGNIFDVTKLVIPDSFLSNTKDIEEKQNLLKEYGLPLQEFELDKEYPPVYLIIALRLYFEEDKGNYESIMKGKFSSFVTNEDKVYSMVIDCCDKFLTSCPSNTDLKSENYHRRLALEFRSFEKATVLACKNVVIEWYKKYYFTENSN